MLFIPRYSRAIAGTQRVAVVQPRGVASRLFLIVTTMGLKPSPSGETLSTYQLQPVVVQFLSLVPLFYSSCSTRFMSASTIMVTNSGNETTGFQSSTRSALLASPHSVVTSAGR